MGPAIQKIRKFDKVKLESEQYENATPQKMYLRKRHSGMNLKPINER